MENGTQYFQLRVGSSRHFVFSSFVAADLLVSVDFCLGQERGGGEPWRDRELPSGCLPPAPGNAAFAGANSATLAEKVNKPDAEPLIFI